LIISIMCININIVDGTVKEYVHIQENNISLLEKERISIIEIKEESEVSKAEMGVDVLEREINPSRSNERVTYNTIKYDIIKLEHGTNDLIINTNSLEQKVKEETKKYEELKYKVENDFKKIPMPIEHKILVIKECEKYNLNPSLIFNIIRVESAYNPKAYNPIYGARGYGQFIPSTAKWVYERELKLGKYNNQLAYNPEINIKMICWYIDYLLKHNNNNLRIALRYYGGDTTDSYANKVLKK